MTIINRFYKGLLGLFLTCGGLLTSCVMEEEMLTKAGQATVRIELNADAAFGTETKAVNEEGYKVLANYTIQILQNGQIVGENNYPYNSLPNSIQLSNGSYTLKAFYGTDVPYSRTAFYVEGTQPFSIEGEDRIVSVNCTPTVGKLITQFDPLMATYFDDYKVTYTTSSIPSGNMVWAKNDTDPWYIRVPETGETVTATITLTPKTVYDAKGTVKTVTKTYKLERNKAWTLAVAPNYTATNGKLSISITIDEKTDDHEIDIVVPADWL